jgi:signal transduction histidine kinase
MEKQINMSGMLELIPQPAFLVSEGTVIQVNQPAKQMMIGQGISIATLLGVAEEEYAAFKGGCLCLTLSICDCMVPAAVTRMGDADLFVMESAIDQAELKAMALTAMEFREPLADIIAIKDRLLDAVDREQNKDVDMWIGQMNRRINQMHRMICNMADVPQYTAQTMPRMTCQNVCAVLDEVFDRVAMLAERAGFRLVYHGLREDIACPIAVDRLERAVYNIISNAMKNSPAGGTIEATLSRKGNKLFLSVRDHGAGVPDHLLSSVYCRYRRQAGIESAPAGMGLGMVLVRNAAAVHGGTVLIDQPKGGGTRITISISIRNIEGNTLRNDVYSADYAGEYDHALLELSDVLPAEFYI